MLQKLIFLQFPSISKVSTNWKGTVDTEVDHKPRRSNCQCPASALSNPNFWLSNSHQESENTVYVYGR